MPVRRRLESMREDPRRELDDSRPAEPSREERLESIVRKLAQAEVERAAVLPKVVKLLEQIAGAVTAPAGFGMREKTDSRIDLEREVQQLRAGIVEEIVKGESVRARAMLVRWTGAAVIEGGRQLWRARVAALVLAAVVGTVGYVTRDCQGHWPVRVSVPTP